MVITMLFYLRLPGKKFCQKILKSKKFQPKFRHQAMVVEVEEAEAVEAEAVEAEAV